MDIYSSSAESYQSKDSAYDALEAVPHVDNYEFHMLQETNRCASAIIQGFARFMYKEKTGEPDIPYNMMHKTLTAFELRVFLFAFGHTPEELPHDVATLWKMVKEQMNIKDPVPEGEKPAPAKTTKKSE